MNSNEQRYELASIITDHVHEGLLGYDACTPHAEIAEAADAILAAGYRKPRTITTVEELDALPDAAVIRGGGSVYEHHWGQFHCTDGGTVDASLVSLPATVIHEPTTEATA